MTAEIVDLQLTLELSPSPSETLENGLGLDASEDKSLRLETSNLSDPLGWPGKQSWPCCARACGSPDESAPCLCPIGPLFQAVFSDLASA